VERETEPILAEPAASGSLPWRILKPGRNCWQIASAQHARVLIDADCYFSSLDQALRQAQNSILILGWDFDGRIKLSRDPDRSSMLGELLRGLVEARPELEVHILVWSFAVVHAPSAALPLIWGDRWQEHPRIHLRLNRQHRVYAAHHEKLVSIDGNIAFAGGIDLTVDRWDTSAHRPDEPARVDPEGQPYPPVHDLQMVVDGEAASALAATARHRWWQATGERVDTRRTTLSAWPKGAGQDFEQPEIALSRTAPRWRDIPAIGESGRLTIDALNSARRSIYIETQYLADFAVGDILARRLSEPGGPDVVLVLTKAFEGLVERWVMGANRDRLVRRLKQADHFDRLRACYPVVGRDDGEHDVIIHSKLMIIDDDLLRIGSSNLNNRSVGVDTELDLAIEARTEATRASIARVRSRLLGEHLGQPAERVAAETASRRSIVQALDALNHGPRGLRVFEATRTPGPTRPWLGTWLLDPRRPLRPFRLLRGWKRRGT
jgi:phosphatidylserine/phosphatidylglycerophosphate/cardiolipin synthase-like enzyme